jgi:[acyl-carrier-protein] S-malonyltransferase
MSYAVLFPGQGSQNKGMLDPYIEDSVFSKIIDQSSEILGYNLTEAVQDESKLNNTLYTQPIMVAVSYAMWCVWKERSSVLPSCAAGHSLGEYTALVANGFISLEDCLNLVVIRAKSMLEAMDGIEGGMAAVIGLNAEDIQSVCSDLSTDKELIQAVNFNSEKQIVVGGHMNLIKDSVSSFKSKGAKLVKVLPVSIAAHTTLMNNCSDILNKLLINMNNINDNFLFPVIHNIDAMPKRTSGDIINALCKQVNSPVLWTKTIESIREMNITNFIEIGPGKVLSGLNKRIASDISSVPISNYENINVALEMSLND